MQLRHNLRPAQLASSLLAALLLCPLAGQALPDNQVSEKLDTILMLMAVDAKGAPTVVSATIEGKKAEVYMAAMSIAAAEQITAGERYGIAPATTKAMRFAPVSLARFNLLLAPLLKANPKRLGVIAPDPTQMAAAEKLLIDQKLSAEQVRKVVAMQPMVFCPEPALLVSSNSGTDKGKQFVPCATEADFVEGIVQRGIKESAKIAATKPKVVAIPLNNFIALLRKGSEANLGQYRVVPSGRMINLIQEIRSKQQTDRAAKGQSSSGVSQQVDPAAKSSDAITPSK